MKNFLLFVLVFGLVGYIAYDKLWKEPGAEKKAEGEKQLSKPSAKPAEKDSAEIGSKIVSSVPDEEEERQASLDDVMKSMAFPTSSAVNGRSLSDDEISALLVEAQKAEEEGRSLDAWSGYTRAHLAGVPEQYEAKLRIKLEAMARAHLAQRQAISGLLSIYQVRPGDSLWEIANRWEKDTGIPVAPGFIRYLNDMSSNNIHEGQKLLVPSSPVRVLCIKSRYRVFLLLGDCYLEEWGVGLGQEGHATPEGTFSIGSRLERPEFTDRERGVKVPYGEPGNPLGTRWLGFSGSFSSYGIHGTWEDDSIGENRSKGCLRMKNEDVEELFELLPLKTQVDIEG
ncbi:MAG: L,D-transpeptidase family protein [Planctomycetota bacterium]